MADQAKGHTLIRLPKSAAMIATASAAIHYLSNARQQLISIRPAAVAGFDQILDDERIKVAILLKIYERLDFSGKGTMHIAFSVDEMRLLHECRAQLQAMTLTRIDRAHTIRLALLRHSRAELVGSTHPVLGK